GNLTRAAPRSTPWERARMAERTTRGETARAIARVVGAWLGRAATASGHALAATARLAWRKRGPIVALLVRVAFWGALALWVTTAIDVVGGAPLDVDRALHRFVTGALACAVAVVLAVARPVRWASWALGSLHGASATVLWLLVTSTG
ncbi:MAG TPA: hypothetical protein VFG69_12140, partial [Nannocystaceae bacterium]|nr:hypothetical protein [Nannocystaceae bacterium]